MADFKNPAAAASRLRSAPIWLTDPHDRETVRQYLHELEAVAREIDEEVLQAGPPQMGSYSVD